jgi:oligopeptide/dipeptide ABC transporter ATP-binding protein
MYAGSIVEELPSAELTECASHPYTRRLLDSVFSVDDRGTKEIQVEELGLETADDVTGCPYAPRCALAQKRCTDARPALQALHAGHRVACWFPIVHIGE